MPDFNTEIEIEPREYISECTGREIKELIEILHEDGELTGYFNEHRITDPDSVIEIVHNGNLFDIEWTSTVVKLSRNRLMITPEEEKIIKKIAGRLI